MTKILEISPQYRRGILTHGLNDNEAIAVGHGQGPEPGDLLTLSQPRTAYIVEKVKYLKADKDFSRMWLAQRAKWIRFGAKALGRLFK